ncbi:MAG: DHHA1 domain-containing protein, partial [Thermoproteota archaeon]|nr:DHHA1 domain-containing protein [Thermoproteota archaeon]
DITHHSALTDEDVVKIEEAANGIIESSMPVKIENFDRGTAEQKYGFRIYQGGVVPVKSVRIVSIGDLDIEACGGTHVANTSDVEQIKITRTKRIQDGVVRIEFVSGEGAKEFVKKKQKDSENKEKEEKLREQERERRLEQRQLAKERIPAIAKSLSECKQGSITIEDITMELAESGKANFCYSTSDNYDDVFHIGLGEILCKTDPKLVYCGLFEQGEKVRAIVYAGEDISKEKRLEQRQIAKERIPIIAKSLLECKQGTTTIDEITIEIVESGKANFCYSDSNNYDDVFHIGLGEVLCKSDPKMVYCGLFEQGEKIRVIVYAGDEISKEKSAGDIVKSISQILGGAGGGSPKFAQGGGTDKSKKEDAIKNAKSMIIE